MVLEAKSHVYNCKNHLVTISVEYHYENITYGHTIAPVKY